MHGLIHIYQITRSAWTPGNLVVSIAIQCTILGCLILYCLLVTEHIRVTTSPSVHSLMLNISCVFFSGMYAITVSSISVDNQYVCPPCGM